MPSRKVVRRRAEAIRRAVLECLEERQLLAYAPVTVSVEAFNTSVSEATASQGGYFQFRAAADMCSSDPPPPSVTVVFQLSGTADDQTDFDADDLLAESVIIDIDPQTGVGSVDLDFFAKDDPITMAVEDTETVVATIQSNSAYSVDPWYGYAEGTIEDDDVNITVESRTIMLTGTREILVSATGYGGAGRSVTLDVASFNDQIIAPQSTQVTTDWDGNALLAVEGLAEGDSNLVFAAPNGKTGQATQRVRKVTIEIVNNPTVYVGQEKIIDVRLRDPENQNNIVTDLGVFGESTTLDKATTPPGNTTPDEQGIYHVPVRGKGAGQAALNIRARRPADDKDAGVQAVNVQVKAVTWTINVDRVKLKQNDTATVTLTARDGANGPLIDGIGIAADFQGTIFSVNFGFRVTGDDGAGKIVLTVSRTELGAFGDQDTLLIHVDGWNPADNKAFEYA